MLHNEDLQVLEVWNGLNCFPFPLSVSILFSLSPLYRLIRWDRGQLEVQLLGVPQQELLLV